MNIENLKNTIKRHLLCKASYEKVELVFMLTALDLQKLSHMPTVIPVLSFESHVFIPFSFFSMIIWPLSTNVSICFFALSTVCFRLTDLKILKKKLYFSTLPIMCVTSKIIFKYDLEPAHAWHLTSSYILHPFIFVMSV